MDGGARVGRFGDGGLLDGGGGVLTAEPHKVYIGEGGKPSNFDPAQIYVHGFFDSVGLDHLDPYAYPCGNSESVIADWSFPENDRHTDLGATVALPCEIEDLWVRADGSILYEQVNRAIRLMIEEPATVEEGSAVISIMSNMARPHDNDRGVGGCWQVDHPYPLFRGFVDPTTGRSVYTCFSGADPNVLEHRQVANSLNDADALPFPVPEGYILTHLGFDAFALVHKVDEPAEMAVLSPDRDLVPSPLPVLGELDQIVAIRALVDGFALLVMRGWMPAKLERWTISFNGEFAVAGSVDDTSITLDVGNCVVGADASKLPSAGCVCAFDATAKKALCLAEESPGGVAVVSFDFEVQPGTSAEVVYRLSDDPYLKGFKGLITGP